MATTGSFWTSSRPGPARKLPRLLPLPPPHMDGEAGSAVNVDSQSHPLRSSRQQETLPARVSVLGRPTDPALTFAGEVWSGSDLAPFPASMLLLTAVNGSGDDASSTALSANVSSPDAEASIQVPSTLAGNLLRRFSGSLQAAPPLADSFAGSPVPRLSPMTTDAFSDRETLPAKVSVSKAGEPNGIGDSVVMAEVVEASDSCEQHVIPVVLFPQKVRVGRDFEIRRYWDGMNATGRHREVKPGRAQGSRDALLRARAPVIICPVHGALVDMRAAVQAAYRAGRAVLEPGDGCSAAGCARSAHPGRHDLTQLNLARGLLDYSRLLCDRPTTVPPDELTLRPTFEAHAAAAAARGMAIARAGRIHAAMLGLPPPSPPSSPPSSPFPEPRSLTWVALELQPMPNCLTCTVPLPGYSPEVDAPYGEHGAIRCTHCSTLNFHRLLSPVPCSQPTRVSLVILTPLADGQDPALTPRAPYIILSLRVQHVTSRLTPLGLDPLPVGIPSPPSLTRLSPLPSSPTSSPFASLAFDLSMRPAFEARVAASARATDAQSVIPSWELSPEMLAAILALPGPPPPPSSPPPPQPVRTALTVLTPIVLTQPVLTLAPAPYVILRLRVQHTSPHTDTSH